MTQIYIPFKERFCAPMLDGTKIMTSRTKYYGRIGDYFNAFGHTFVLTSVVKRHLDFIMDHWKEEGCSSKEDFLAVWKSIHPVRNLDMTEMFWVHSFQDVTAKKLLDVNK